MEAKRELSLDELDQVVGGKQIPCTIIPKYISKNYSGYQYFIQGKCPSCHKPFSHDTTCEACGVCWIEA